MPRALKGRMPRVCKDHRSTRAKRLARVYLDLGERFALADGISRRVAVLVAQNFLNYEDVTQDLGAPHKPVAVRRLQRRQGIYQRDFLAGLHELQSLTTKFPKRVNVAEEFAAMHEGAAPCD